MRGAVRMMTFGLALALATGPAPTTAGADPDPRVAQRPGAPKDKRDKVRQRIRVMRALILAEELQLDEATAAKLAPTLNRFDDEMAKLLSERQSLRAELHDALEASDDKRLVTAVDRLVANQDARWGTERKRFADLRKVLTARQAAQLLDVLPEIDRRIMKGLRPRLAPRRPSGRGLRGGPGGSRPAGLSGDDHENPF